MRTIPFILCLILVTSCIKEIPVDMQQSHRQVIVTGLIYPDTTISLNISNLKGFSDTTGANSTKILEISLMEDGVLTSHPEGPGPEILTLTYPKEGSEYSLTVRTETDTLTASTMIPGKVLISKADYWFSKIPSQNFDRPVEASITWEDPAGMDNYYELQILEGNMKAQSFYQFDQIDDPVIQQECDLDYAPTSFVFSDRLFEGKSYTLSLRFGVGYGATGPDHTYVVLRSISKEYYLFKKSWHKHIFLQNTSISWDGKLSFTDVYSLLFYGDPTSLYTNIQKGAGVFAGFSQDIREFRFIE